MGKKKKQKDRFELWRDRSFSIIVPFFFGYILLTQTHNNTIRLVLIILLLGFATGEMALFGRYLLNVIGRILGGHHESEDGNLSKDRKTSKTRDNKEDGAG